MSLKQTIKTFNKEFQFVIFSGFIIGFTFISVFYSYSIIWITQERNDDDDVQRSRNVIFGYAIMEFMGKMSASLCQCARKRKRLFLIGYIFVFSGWTCIWIANISQVGSPSILQILTLCRTSSGLNSVERSFPTHRAVQFTQPFTHILETFHLLLW